MTPRRLLSALVLAAVVCSTPSSYGQGSCASGWSPLTPAGLPDPILSLAAFDQGGGPLLYMGALTPPNGWNTGLYSWNGSVFTPMITGGICGAYPCPQPIVRAMLVFDDGGGPALYVGVENGGWGPPVSNGDGVFRWDGATATQLGGLISGVHALATFDAGTGPEIYAGGSFLSAGGVAANGIARWGGSSWLPVGTGVSGPGPVVRVSALVAHDDGTGPALYVGGLFSSAGGIAAPGIARWNGLNWSAVGGGFSSGSSLPEVQAFAVYDDGSGPALYAGGQFDVPGGSGIAKWDGSNWAGVGGGVSGFPARIHALTVHDEGNGPALFAGGQFSSAGTAVASNIARWSGAAWSALGAGIGGGAGASVDALAVLQEGASTVLCVGGNFTVAGSASASNIARWSCGSTISVSATQSAVGAPVHVNNANLTPGHEYFNVFSLDLCPGGPGTGFLAYGGLCITTPQNQQFVVSQLLSPPGTPLLRFNAPSSYVSWGPYSLPPLTVDALCFDITGGVLGPVSHVSRITVQ